MPQRKLKASTGQNRMAKEEFETVTPGGSSGMKSDRLSSKEHQCNCQCAECLQKLKKLPKKRDQSLIGGHAPVPDTKVSLPPLPSSSVTERANQKALKMEAPDKIVFRCPNCDAALRMHVSKRQAWDDSDSLSDAKDDWSRRSADE